MQVLFRGAPCTACRWMLVVASAAAVWCSPAVVRGDYVKMIDGRYFEGTILEETDAHVKIDARVGRVRAAVTLPTREIAELKKEPLPANFWEGSASTEAPSTPAKKFPEGTVLYLEVPIVGQFGKQVVYEGVRRSLSYAVTRRIPHVVFFVDSQGGDQVIAGEIYELLGKYNDRLTYHALVRDSVGVAMAVTVWCDSVFILPGANLGGIVLQGEGGADGREIELSQIAWEVGEEAEKHGWPSALVRAMIDPRESVAAWVQSGKVMTAPRPPSSLSRSELVVSEGSQSVLTLTREQAVRLGIGKAFNGNASDLGYELGIDKWTPESAYGRDAMVKAVQYEKQRRERAESRAEAKIERMVAKRKSTKRYIDRYLTLAHQWDPDQNAKSTYKDYQSRWERYWGGPLEGTVSRRRYRELTDLTMASLLAAHKGVRQMQKLEAEAQQLGLEPLYGEDELENLVEDLNIKVTMLRYWRNRRTSAT